MAVYQQDKGIWQDFALTEDKTTVKEANDLRQADALEGLVETTKTQTDATFDLNKEVSKLHEAVAPLNKTILDLIKAI
jgi:hypothetical protein